MHNISSGTIPYILITDFKTGTMSIPLLNQSLSIPYTISFTTLKGSTIPSILANTSISQDFNISDAPLPNGDEIISLVYTFSEDIPVGASFDTPLSINGQVAIDAPKPSYAYMDTTFFWYTVSNGDQQVDANATCTIDDMSELYMTAIEVSPNNSVKPGDTITYQATIDCRYSPLKQPLFVMILDPNLSYANYITYTDEDGSTATLLPVELEMTGVKIIPPILGTVTLGGFVWEDLAKTGIYQAGDPGINDTAVILYDHTGTFLQTVFTPPNTSGQAGYYTFSNIPHGQYYIKFVPNTLRYALTKQVLDNPNGSMPFPNTGVTPLIDMTTLTENLNIITGLIDISQMNTILAINKSANKMLRSVIYSQMLLDMKLEDTIKLID